MKLEVVTALGFKEIFWLYLLVSTWVATDQHANVSIQELEEKRKARAKVAYERRKQLTNLRAKAEKAIDEKLGSQLDILAPLKY